MLMHKQPSHTLLTRSVLILCLTCISCVLCPAQDSSLFDHIDKKESGLSHNGIKCLMRDSRGYLWVGTHMGLNRYDGTRVKVFPKDVLPSSYIFSLCEDKESNIWIGTTDGAVVYRYESDSFFVPTLANGEIPEGKVLSIACNSKGEIWIDTGYDKLYSFNWDDGFIREHFLGVGPGRKNLAFDSKDRLIIAFSLWNLYTYSDEGLVEVDLTSAGNPLKYDDLYGPVISRESDDIVYVAAKRCGLVEVDMRKHTARTLMSWNDGQRPTDICQDRQGRLWISTSEGLVRFDPFTGQSKTFVQNTEDKFSVSDNHLTCVTADDSGSVFAGTIKDGVSFINAGMHLFHRVHKTEDGCFINGCYTRALCEDNNGMVWIATEKMGLFRYDIKEKKLYSTHYKGVPSFLTAVIADGNSLWLGSLNGIIHLDPLTGQTRIYSKFGDDVNTRENRIISMFLAKNGSLYSSTSSCFLQYDRSADEFNILNTLGTRAYWDIVEDASGTLWLASFASGLFSCDPDHGYKLTPYRDCPQRMLSSISFDADSTLWVVGYESKISMLSKTTGEFKSFSPKYANDRPNSSFMAGIHSGDDFIVPSSAGLFVFDKHNGGVRNFSATDGLVDDNFSEAAALLSSGEVILGSQDGMIVFDPGDIRHEHQAECIDITAMYIGDELIHPLESNGVISRNINLADNITLAPQNNFFSLEFANPSQLSSSDISCFLEGFDTEPRSIKSDTRISWFNIPPGKYTLHISSHKDITVTVTPPFWRSTTGTALIAVLTLLMLTLMWILIYYLQLRAQKQRQEEFQKQKKAALVNEKMNFLANVVHEIKTPLTVMKTPLSNLLSSTDMNDGQRQDLKHLSKSTDYLERLSRELLEFIRVEQLQYTIHTKPMDIVEVIGIVCSTFEQSCKENCLELKFKHSAERIIVNAEEKSIIKILNNLMSNALKYSESYIEVEAVCEGDNVKVFFRNDGKPIPKNRREDIFERFTRLDESDSFSSNSFGIGLPLARSLAVLHNGSLELSESERTEFVLTLPGVLHEDTVIEPQAEINSDLPSILIVEDNKDLLEFLRSKLQDRYNISIAASARQAMTLIGQHNVDMIITDINMPGVDGIEFCRKIRDNFDTSHIPVIVMSANADEKAKILSMESGASFYIEKPFTIEYLNVVIDGILKARQSLLDSAQQNGSGLELSEFKIEDKDALFLKKLSAVVDEHLQDDGFSASQLEEALFISHASLNRKMKGLIGTTPVEYIRAKRLNRAAALLKEGNLSITEVCYMVGFSAPSYFTRCFKEYFGKTPAEYTKD